MSKKLILLGCTVIYSVTAFAQSTENEKKDSSSDSISLKELVITGTRFEIPIEKSGKTIYKISADDIEENAGKTVVDILNEVPGVQMEGNFGTPGTNIGIYARGGRNKNTLILIDGVPLNDPSGINASYDLRLLPISQIESIEVLKGGLSTLYGTGASAAVINITLKENNDEDFGGNLDLNYGSYGTIRTSVNIQGEVGKLNYLLSGSFGSSDGFTAASEENSSTSFGKDGFDQKNALIKFGYQFNESFNVDAIVSLDDFEADYDDGAFLDAENVQKGRMLRFGLTPTFKYDDGIIKLKTIYAENEREFISSFPIEYEGRNLQLDLSQRHYLSSSFTGMWGIGMQSFSYKQNESIDFDETKFELVDPYASLFYEDNSGFTIHVGGRLNTHSEYDSKFIYNVNPSYLIELSDNMQVKLLVSVATTYITPTGFQLFSSFGNKELNPEESLSLEFGGSLYVNKSLVLNTVYFKRSEESAIDFVSEFDVEGNFVGGAYQNLAAERDVKGVELDLTYKLSGQVSFSSNYSHVSTDDITSFYRIPEDKFGISTTISPIKNSTVTIKYNYTGSRTIFDFGIFGEVDLESYGLVDVYAKHRFLDKKLMIYGAVNNLLDNDFVSVYGFTTRGRNYNLGLKYSF